MTIIWCLLSFILGLGIGWIIFKPSDYIEEIDNEDENEEELDECRQHFYYENNKKDEDAVFRC